LFATLAAGGPRDPHPFPTRRSSDLLPAALSVSVLVAFPANVGAKTTEISQCVPGARMPFHVPLATQEFPERANGPVRATLVSEAPVALVLVTTRCPSGLVVPMATDPKDRLLGDTEKEVDGGGGVFETVTV